ncbi:MAG: hypothetical protein AAB654_23245 [Acidobacteriota bacterium]
MLHQLFGLRHCRLDRGSAGTSGTAELAAELLDGSERFFMQGIKLQDAQVLDCRDLEPAAAMQSPGKLERRPAAARIDLHGALPDFDGFLEATIVQQQAAKAGQCPPLLRLTRQNFMERTFGEAQPAGLRMALGEAESPLSKIENLGEEHCCAGQSGDSHRPGTIVASRRNFRAPTFMKQSQSLFSQPFRAAFSSLRSLLDIGPT